MNDVGLLAPGEVGREAAAAIGQMTTRAIAGVPVASYVEADPLPWATIRSGGWDLLGVPEEAGGAGAGLRDLVEVARVWGRAVLPSPLIPSLLAKRWSSAARRHSGPVTISVPAPGARGTGSAPFGDSDAVRLLLATEENGVHEPMEGAAADPFAPSLRLVQDVRATAWTPAAAQEMSVVWAAEATGCADQMLAAAVAYAREREQFGRPIGSFQAVKHQLATAHVLVEQAETAVLLAVVEPERSVAATRFAFDASLRVVETAVQVHGGLGFTWEMGLHVYLRHVAALRDLAAGLRA